MSAAVSLGAVDVSLDGRRVLRGVTLCVEPGEWVSVIGPNGAGKTTLLRAVAGLVIATGTVEVAGVGGGRARRRALARAVAYVPQDPLLPEAMTVRDYALLGRTAHLPYLGVEGRRDHEVIGDVLHRLDLGDLADRDLHSLSGGERQRATLARALAQEATVLLLDEQTSALDVGHQQQVLELIESVRHERGLAVLSAMHDLTLAGQFADRLALLVHGEIVETGPAEHVLHEDALSEHWGARVRILRDPDGGVVVIPVRAPRPPAATRLADDG